MPNRDLASQSVPYASLTQTRSGMTIDIRSLRAVSEDSIHVSRARRNFTIRYQEDTKTYTIQDLGLGSGTFIKVTGSHRITAGANTIFNFGEQHIVARPIQTSGAPKLTV
jgi:hypothetical protein